MSPHRLILSRVTRGDIISHVTIHSSQFLVVNSSKNFSIVGRIICLSCMISNSDYDASSWIFLSKLEWPKYFDQTAGREITCVFYL